MAKYTFIRNGVLISPFFIFIKGGSRKPDIELISCLGLENYARVLTKEALKEPLWRETPILITEDENWTHIMDSWYYKLWHDQNLQNNLQKLALEFDIFCCTSGDSDDSLDFTYYKGGKLRRKYVLEDPYYGGKKLVAENYGEPFPIEKEALACTTPEETIIMIAKSLGITFNHTKEGIRIYDVETKTGKQSLNLWDRLILKLRPIFA